MSLYEKTKKNIWFAMLPTDAPLINLNLFKNLKKYKLRIKAPISLKLMEK
jgi:molybdopterin-guanine dinucleotide biosynthesis protein A